jgi:hypothetical protein
MEKEISLRSAVGSLDRAIFIYAFFFYLYLLFVVFFCIFFCCRKKNKDWIEDQRKFKKDRNVSIGLQSLFI